MQLKKELPQFTDSPSLIITTGWQVAKFFLALNGGIELEKTIEIENPKYSDKDGRTQRSVGTSGTVRTGTPEEDNKDYVRKEFLKLFKSYLVNRIKSNDLKSIYIFTPSQGLNELKEGMSNDLKDLIKGFYIGNYAHKSPDELVGMIKEEQQSKSVEIMTEEARKILDKTNDI